MNPASVEVDRLTALVNSGACVEAERAARKLLKKNPKLGEAWNVLGIALHMQAKDGLPAFRRAASCLPESPQVLNNLAVVLLAGGRVDDAIASCTKALGMLPNYPEALNNLGIAYGAVNKYENAIASYLRALDIKPDYTEAIINLANAYKNMGRHDEALTSYLRALEIKPDFAEAYVNLGSAYKDIGRYDDAVRCYLRAIEIKPNVADAYVNLGNAYKDIARYDDAIASYRRALAIDRNLVIAYSNLLFCLGLMGGADAQAVFSEHCAFAEWFETPYRNARPAHANSRNPDRSLRIGFVSGDFRAHAVANFIEPILARLADQPTISLYAYHNHQKEDPITLRLREHFVQWHSIAGRPDGEVAKQILDDKIDILVDLSGHTAHNRLLVFARKPAPIQVSWIGYGNTTGLQAMDYVIKDCHNAPHGAYERFYVEKFARIPSSGTFLPFEDAPPVNDLPARLAGHVTFGSFNRANKLNDETIALWSRVLLAVPNAKLLLGGMAGDDSINALVERFGRNGISVDSLIFQPFMEMKDYLAQHHRVDLIMDAFPSSGGSTTNHALWMGVPVLTLTGSATALSHSGGIQRRAGLSDWVADDPEQFVRRAVNWAGRLDELAELRAGMRDRLASSLLRQPDVVAKGFEAASRAMWRRWCAGKRPEHFEIGLDEISGGHS